MRAPIQTRAAAVPQQKGGRTAARPPESTHMKSSTIPLFGQQAAAPRVPKTTTEVITPDLARRMRETAHFSRQRNISPTNVSRLAAEMKAGRFTPGTQVYICVLPDGTERIINGNHTLEAVASSGVAQILTVTRHPVADEEEAGRIYAVFDVQKVRSWGDSLRAVGVGDDIPMASQLLAAINVIELDFGHRNFNSGPRLERINRLAEYAEPMKMWDAAVKGGPRHIFVMLKRAPVLAVAVETFRYQPVKAAEFWGAAAHDDGLAANRPEKALLNWLRNTRGTGGTLFRRDHARAAALAWNAAFRGEERNHVRPNSMAAFFLLGTPFAGGLRG